MLTYIIPRLFHWFIITWEMRSVSIRSLRISLYLKVICKSRLPWRWETVQTLQTEGCIFLNIFSTGHMLLQPLSRSLLCIVQCWVDLGINFMLLLINQGNIPPRTLTCTACSSRGSGKNMWMHQQFRLNNASCSLFQGDPTSSASLLNFYLFF